MSMQYACTISNFEDLALRIFYRIFRNIIGNTPQIFYGLRCPIYLNHCFISLSSSFSLTTRFSSDCLIPLSIFSIKINRSIKSSIENSSGNLSSCSLSIVFVIISNSLPGSQSCHFHPCQQTRLNSTFRNHILPKHYSAQYYKNKRKKICRCYPRLSQTITDALV